MVNATSSAILIIVYIQGVALKLTLFSTPARGAAIGLLVKCLVPTESAVQEEDSLVWAMKEAAGFSSDERRVAIVQLLRAEQTSIARL